MIRLWGREREREWRRGEGFLANCIRHHPFFSFIFSLNFIFAFDLSFIFHLLVDLLQLSLRLILVLVPIPDSPADPVQAIWRSSQVGMGGLARWVPECLAESSLDVP